MNAKKVISLVLSAIVLSCFPLQFLNSMADSNTDTNATEYVPSETSEEVVLNSSDYQSLPNAVDLSTSPCFPPIANQGSLVKACVAFTTTYYQYSYQVNKLNNVASAGDAQKFSPNFVYSLGNQGVNQGITYYSAYEVLKNLGCVTTDVLPITDNYQIWLKDNVSERIEALKTRVISDDKLLIPNNTNISSPSNLISRNFPLSEVKAKLNDGYVLVAGSKGYFDSVNVDGECIAFRCNDGGVSNYAHSLAIVGYNNYIEYDVNGNGTIESYEKGAFKVASSWGENFDQNGLHSNTGYFWVMYDALNLSSTNTYNEWENQYNTTRYPAFCLSKEEGVNNEFRFIEVGHKDIKVVGELDISTYYKYKFELSKRVTDSSSASIYGSPIVAPYYNVSSRRAEFNGKIIFDYTDCIDKNGIEDYYNNHYYHLMFSNFDPNAEGNSASFKLLDDKGYLLSDNEQYLNNPVKKYIHLNYDLGDVDYDGSVTARDAELVQKILAQIVIPSNFQKKLSDYNSDGEIDITDVLLIRSAALSTSSAVEILELDQMIKSYVEQNNIMFNDDDLNIYNSICENLQSNNMEELS